MYFVQPKKRSVQKQLVKLLTPSSKQNPPVLFKVSSRRALCASVCSTNIRNSRDGTPKNESLLSSDVLKVCMNVVVPLNTDVCKKCGVRNCSRALLTTIERKLQQ